MTRQERGTGLYGNCHHLLDRSTSPHFSPVVCCSAGYIRHYCVALGRAPRRTVKYACVALPARALPWRRLRRFATTTGEKGGLVRDRVAVAARIGSRQAILRERIDHHGRRAPGHSERTQSAHLVPAGSQFAVNGFRNRGFEVQPVEAGRVRPERSV